MIHWILCLKRPIRWLLSTHLAFAFAYALAHPHLALAQDAQNPEGIAYFEQFVRPLLVEHCYECHSANAKPLQGGLLLDNSEKLHAGGESGAILIPGKPDESLIVQAVRYKDPNTSMPPEGRLSDAKIARIEEWVRMGAPMPKSVADVTMNKSIDIEAGRLHWSFLSTKLLPTDRVGSQADRLYLWQANRIDSGIARGLEEQGLEPSSAADRRTLLRRLNSDLLGLLPDADEVASFEQDNSLDAYERRVDEYLSSPHYGERWGRYWLDLVRYCDVLEEWVETLGPSYPYRDWVIGAFNKDLPFDEFVRLQLAADQIPSTPSSDLAALGFLGLSPSYWKELQLPVEIIKVIVSDEVEERVHTVSSTLLGLNLACARCHDHKYDPLTNTDYYALAGVLSNAKPSDVALVEGVNADQVVEARKLVKKLEAELQGLAKSEKEEDKAKAEEVRVRIQKAKEVVGYDSLLTPGMRDARLEVRPADGGAHGSKIVYEPDMRDASLEIRGNPNKLGAVVPRRFVSVLTSPTNKPTIETSTSPGGSATAIDWNAGSGRLAFAHAVTSEAGDLVARVFVNRIWKHHFGRGIVQTPSDFGKQGESPTHPELLDDLAFRFRESGWSIKSLHREILLSATYRQQRTVSNERDPDQRWYSSFPRRPLDVEAWRDSILQVTDGLDERLGGPPLELNSNPVRRTVYGLVKRREINDLLRLFDFPDPLTHSPTRVPTITPLQQLYVLNSPFIVGRAQALIQRLDRERLASDDGDVVRARIRTLYGWLFQREPRAGEMAKVVAFVQEGTANIAGVSIPAGGANPAVAAETWVLVAQTLLASNEFYYLD